MSGNGRYYPGGRQVHPDLLQLDTPTGHRYLHTPTGTWMKGLTRILDNLPMDESLVRWIADVGSHDAYLAKLEAARKRGEAVHQAIEDLLKGKKIKRTEMDEEPYEHVESWVNFYLDYHPQTQAIEEAVWDTRRRIATMLDWRGTIRPADKRGKVQGAPQQTVLDWKTSSGVWPSHIVQVMEGAWLKNEMGGNVQQVGIVRTGTKHRRKYEYQSIDLAVERERFEYNHKLVSHLVWVEHFREPQWVPQMPRPLPESLSLPRAPAGQPLFDEP